MAKDTKGIGYDDRTIGRRLRSIRRARGKSLRVIAGLAGISASHLSRLENGTVSLDRRSEVVALANALRISPSELTALPIPAPADGDSDSAIHAVRRALMGVSRDRPGGQAGTVEELIRRVDTVENADYGRRGLELPGLIANLHSTLAAGEHVFELQTPRRDAVRPNRARVAPRRRRPARPALASIHARPRSS